MLSTHNTNSILSKDNNSSYSQPAPFKSTFSLSIGCVVIGLLLAGATVVFIWRRALGRPPAFDFGRGAWVPGVSRGFGERPRLWDRWREVPSHDQPLEWAKMKPISVCTIEQEKLSSSSNVTLAPLRQPLHDKKSGYNLEVNGTRLRLAVAIALPFSTRNKMDDEDDELGYSIGLLDVPLEGQL